MSQQTGCKVHDPITMHGFWDLVSLVCMYVLQIRQPHFFFFFLLTHTERMVITMIMAAMNTTTPNATEVAKVTPLTPVGGEVVAADCEVLAVGCEMVAVGCEVVAVGCEMVAVGSEVVIAV